MSTEVKTEALAFSLALLEGIYRRCPDELRCVEMLANMYTVAGNYEKGLELDLLLVARDPENPTAHYNCACSLSLTGRIDEAFAKLHKALELGFDDMKLLHGDADLQRLHDDPRWAELPSEEPHEDEDRDLDEDEDEENSDEEDDSDDESVGSWDPEDDQEEYF